MSEFLRSNQALTVECKSEMTTSKVREHIKGAEEESERIERMYDESNLGE